VACLDSKTQKEKNVVTRANSINVVVEAAIVHAVSEVRQSLQRETIRVETQEINRAVLVALARVVARELTASNGVNESDPVISCMPWNAGTHFLIALQDELRRLYTLRSRTQ
jgi:hypothetical protein